MSRILRWRGHAWIALVVRLYLGSVFLTACIHKILHPDVFALDVATYQLLPLWAVNFYALVVPWVELIAGAMLVLGVRVRGASLLVLLMMISFMIALGWALHIGLDMSCGCFASQAAADEDAISWRTMLRDSVWLVQSIYVLLVDRRPLGLERLLQTWRHRHA
ncbi:MAG: DoxX family membrane protein [Polyangiaceae bacterium]|nr:DoxX family membrane protein [Polyangiaceae bacterium]